jgi:hypothetical protein
VSDTTPTSFLIEVHPTHNSLMVPKRSSGRYRALVMNCRVVSYLTVVAQANFITVPGNDQYAAIVKVIVLVSIPS